MKLLQDEEGRKIIQQEMEKHQPNNIMVQDSSGPEMSEKGDNGEKHGNKFGSGTSAIILTSFASVGGDDVNGKFTNTDKANLSSIYTAVYIYKCRYPKTWM